MKMRVMYYSKKAKLVTYATAIGEAYGCLVNDIPPAYPADKERLVVLALTLGNTDPADEVRRFCKELYPNRAQNVVLLVDGEQNTRGEKMVKEAARMGFTRVILPRRNQEKIREIPSGLRLIGVTNVKEAIEALQG